MMAKELELEVGYDVGGGVDEYGGVNDGVSDYELGNEQPFVKIGLTGQQERVNEYGKREG